MKSHLRNGIAVIALLSSVGVAAAAGMAKSSAAADTLTLTSAQQKTIWQDVSKLQTNSKAPAGFSAKVGATVPSAVMLHPLPTAVTNSISATRPFEYAMLDQKLLIVNPTDKKVVDIITQSGASG